MDHILTLKCKQVKQQDMKNKFKLKQHFNCCLPVKTT